MDAYNPRGYAARVVAHVAAHPELRAEINARVSPIVADALRDAVARTRSGLLATQAGKRAETLAGTLFERARGALDKVRPR